MIVRKYKEKYHTVLCYNKLKNNVNIEKKLKKKYKNMNLAGFEPVPLANSAAFQFFYVFLKYFSIFNVN